MSKIVGGDECIGDDAHGRRDRVLIDIHDDDVVAVGGRAAVATATATATVRMDKIINDIVDAAVNY